MNALLSLLTGRNSFNSPFLTTGGAPLNLRDTPDLVAARAFLRLDYTRDDYAVVAAISLLEGIGQPVVSSLLAAELDLSDVSYAPSAFRPEPAQLHGGVLIPTYAEEPKLGIVPDAWPPVTEYRITAINPGIARWEDDAHRQRMIPTQVSNGVLKVSWPVDSIVGWVTPNTPWTTGSMLLVSGKPIRFPHTALDAAMNGQRWVERLLDQAGLAGYRLSQTDAAERNAAVYAAIAYTAWKENRETFS